MAGFTTVRNLGLMVYTAGFLLDVDLARAVDQGWFPGPRIFPAGHAITPTGGHLDPTMFQGLAPGIMPQSVESGIANGVSEVRKSVRYQMKYGAKLIKISASGGVMSFSSAAGAQQYSDEELAAIVDEAHRNGLRVAAHAHGDAGIRACIRAGVDCIEHGSLASDDTIKLMAESGTFLVGTTALADHMAIDRIHPILQKKAAEIFPQARQMFAKALAAGVKIACGSDAPAIPHGTQADELIAMCRPGHDAAAGPAGRHPHQRRSRRAGARPGAARTRLPGRRHRRARRPHRGHQGDQGRQLRHEGRRRSTRASDQPDHARGAARS